MYGHAVYPNVVLIAVHLKGKTCIYMCDASGRILAVHEMVSQGRVVNMNWTRHERPSTSWLPGRREDRAEGHGGMVMERLVVVFDHGLVSLYSPHPSPKSSHNNANDDYAGTSSPSATVSFHLGSVVEGDGGVAQAHIGRHGGMVVMTLRHRFVCVPNVLSVVSMQADPDPMEDNWTTEWDGMGHGSSLHPYHAEGGHEVGFKGNPAKLGKGFRLSPDILVYPDVPGLTHHDQPPDSWCLLEHPPMASTLSTQSISHDDWRFEVMVSHGKRLWILDDSPNVVDQHVDMGPFTHITASPSPSQRSSTSKDATGAFLALYAPAPQHAIHVWRMDMKQNLGCFRLPTGTPPPLFLTWYSQE